MTYMHTWLPMESAPKDGTEIELMIYHRFRQYCETDENRREWEQIVRAKWINFNGGGWTWHGIAGEPQAWRNIAATEGDKP